MKKIVFLNIVDGTRDDYANLRNILIPIAKDKVYDFVTSPKQITSISIDNMKEMIKTYECERRSKKVTPNKSEDRTDKSINNS